MPTTLAGEGVDPLAYPWYPDAPIGGGTALVVTDPDTFRTLSKRARSTSPATPPTCCSTPTRRPPSSRARCAAVEAFERLLYDPEHRCAPGLSEAEPDGISPQVVTAAPQVLDGARRTADQAQRAGLGLRAGHAGARPGAAAGRAGAARRRGGRSSTRRSPRSACARPSGSAIAVLGGAARRAARRTAGLALARADVAIFGPPGRRTPAPARRDRAALPGWRSWWCCAVAAWSPSRRAGARSGPPRRPAAGPSARWSVWQVVVVVVAAARRRDAGRHRRAVAGVGTAHRALPPGHGGRRRRGRRLAVAAVRARLPRLPVRPGSAGWLARARAPPRGPWCRWRSQSRSASPCSATGSPCDVASPTPSTTRPPPWPVPAPPPTSASSSRG